MHLPKSTYRFMIAGGGTGGHIFPALAIAKALESLITSQQVELLFVGAKGKTETKIIPEAGYKLMTLSVIGLPRNKKNIIKLIHFAILTLVSLFRVKLMIKKFKPDAVIGVGGYTSFPTLYIAQKMNIKSFIQEQNAFAGLVNKVLASKTTLFFGGYKNIKGLPSCNFVYTGNPIRKQIQQANNIRKNKAISYFNLDSQKPVILILGGSQGARKINHTILACLEQLINKGIQLIWQTGVADFTSIKNILDEKYPNYPLQIKPFVDKMEFAYAAANLIISRAGALTIAEICFVGKPSILVPLPSAAEDHQTYNAKVLADQEAAILIPEKDLEENLIRTVEDILVNTKKQKSMAQNMRKFNMENADITIAKKIINSINQ